MPVTVSQYDHLASEILTLYEEAENIMINRIAKSMQKGLTSSSWAIQKYSEVHNVRKSMQATVEKLTRERSAITDAYIRKSYGDASMSFVRETKKVASDFGIAGLSPNSRKALAIIADLNNTLNVADRLIVRKAVDAYSDIVARSSALVASGTITLREAVQRELNAFAEKGISSFVDKNGRSWEMSTYAEMATLTAIERASLYGYVDTMQEYGYDLAIISSHGGACPLCVAWEDVIISVSGHNTDYPSLDDAMADGVFHPRCLHHISTYYEGVTRHGRSHPREVEQSSPGYSARQHQRQYERKVRQWKRRMSAALTPEEEREAYAHVRRFQAKLRRLRTTYNATSSETLPRKYWREGGLVKLSPEAKRLKPVRLSE